MGAVQNLQNPFARVDNLTQPWLIPYAFNATGIAVSVGDAIFYKGPATQGLGGAVAYPADQMATLGSEILDQLQFARLFVGYSQEKILATETNPNKQFTVRVSGPILATCLSQTWNKGDLVGIYSNGVAINPQQVDKVTQTGAAIGVCIQEQPTASTTVLFQTQSRYTDLIAQTLQFAGMGDQQTMNAANVLADASQTFTLTTPYFSTMLNTAGRFITLPKESVSRNVQFYVANLTGSIGSITFFGSAGGNALCSNVLPAGKVAMLFCDGVNWYSFISA